MHIIQIVRNYLGLTQQELARRVGITQPDLCEMEIKEPYGRIDKYQRLSNYLGIPVHALVTNDCTLVPLSFFDKHPPLPYSEIISGATIELGRGGEDAALQLEQERLKKIYPNLAKLVLPFYKLRHRPGYDILSFDDSGKPFYIEVKTSSDDNLEFTLTKQEYRKARKAVAAGEQYLVYRYTSWGTDHQNLEIFDFKDIMTNGEISPSNYLCSMNQQKPEMTGIEFYRRMRGLSKSELSDYLGIQTPHLWRYETGIRKCSVEMYLQLANILDVNIDDLLENHICANC